MLHHTINELAKKMVVAYSTLDNISTGQLFLESSKIKIDTQEKQLYQSTLLLNTTASFDINGVLATVTITQSFINKCVQVEKKGE